MAAHPTPDSNPLPPTDLPERQTALTARTGTALKELAMQAGVHIPTKGGKAALVDSLARDPKAMELFGWKRDTTPAADEPTASTGDVDQDGQIVGDAEFTDEGLPIGVDPDAFDDEGFPEDVDVLPKLSSEHLDGLVNLLVTRGEAAQPDAFPGRAEKAAWIASVAYVVEDDEDEAKSTAPAAADDTPNTPTLTEAELANDPAAGDHTPEGDAAKDVDPAIPTAGVAKAAKAGEPQLTLFPGGDAPDKSFLNVASLRVDLGKLQYEKGERIRVTFDMEVDTVAFPPERSGKKVVGELRTHAGTVDVTSIEVSAAS